MKKQESYSLLSELLNKQIISLTIATSYLNDIKDSIESGNIESLQQLIQHNEIPLSQIEEQEIARYSLIESCGFEKNKEGFQLCVNACDNSDGTLNELYKRLNQSLTDLQNATEVSGLLVSKNKERVKKSLSILTGNAMKKDHTYSSKGTTKQDALTRPLAIA